MCIYTSLITSFIFHPRYILLVLFYTYKAYYRYKCEFSCTKTTQYTYTSEHFLFVLSAEKNASYSSSVRRKILLVANVMSRRPSFIIYKILFALFIAFHIKRADASTRNASIDHKNKAQRFSLFSLIKYLSTLESFHIGSSRVENRFDKFSLYILFWFFFSYGTLFWADFRRMYIQYLYIIFIYTNVIVYIL